MRCSCKINQYHLSAASLKTTNRNDQFLNAGCYFFDVWNSQKGKQTPMQNMSCLKNILLTCSCSIQGKRPPQHFPFTRYCYISVFFFPNLDLKLFQKQKKGYNNEQKLCVRMKHCFLMHALKSFTKLWIFLDRFQTASSACTCAVAWYMLLVIGLMTDRLLLVRNVYIARFPAVPLPSPKSMNVMARPTNISPLSLFSHVIVLVAIQNNQRKPEIGVIFDLTLHWRR